MSARSVAGSYLGESGWTLPAYERSHGLLQGPPAGSLLISCVHDISSITVIDQAKAAASLWMKRLSDVLKLGRWSYFMTYGLAFFSGTSTCTARDMMLTSKSCSSVVGKSPHEIHVSTCKTLDDLTILLQSLGNRHRKLLLCTSA